LQQQQPSTSNGVVAGAGGRISKKLDKTPLIYGLICELILFASLLLDDHLGRSSSIISQSTNQQHQTPG
jgi:hypothetical protein